MQRGFLTAKVTVTPLKDVECVIVDGVTIGGRLWTDSEWGMRLRFDCGVIQVCRRLRQARGVIDCGYILACRWLRQSCVVRTGVVGVEILSGGRYAPNP